MNKMILKNLKILFIIVTLILAGMFIFGNNKTYAASIPEGGEFAINGISSYEIRNGNYYKAYTANWKMSGDVTVPFSVLGPERSLWCIDKGGPMPDKVMINYDSGVLLDPATNQDTLFVLTAPLSHIDENLPYDPHETLTQAQKAAGYFTVAEKQYAIWEFEINTGNRLYTDSDRGLGDIAKKYQTFFNSIHTYGYKNYINLTLGYESTITVINGAQYNTYKYPESYVNVQGNTYRLGPYTIDYTIDDIYLDSYKTTDGYYIKFNWNESVTLYNQDGIDIKTLGASFKMIDTNGAEISEITSGRPFYIEIDTSKLQEDITNIYAKIDFKYLEHIDGKIYKHKGYYKYQNLMEYVKKSGKRNYNTYSIVLAADLDGGEERPEIIIKKVDMQNSALKGAEFTAQIKANNNVCTKAGLTTNDAGEIILYTSDLKDLGVKAFSKWSGTLEVTIRETKAPDGYKGVGNVTSTITFTNGVITNVSENTSINKISYKDNKGIDKETQIPVISIKNELDSTLKIRKVDGDNDVQRYLGGATFDITVSAQPKVKNVAKFTRTSDAETGYIDITDKVREAVGTFGKYTGTVTVKMKETANPSGYAPIPELTLSLEYRNGELINSQYSNDVSKATIDIAKNKEDVTIGIKNTKILEYINLAKIDNVSKIGIPGVEFRISMSSEDEESHPEIYTSVTSSDGLIIIDESELNKVGIAERYTGKLNLVIEEITTPDGYKALSEPIEMTVEYEDGVIKTTSKQKGQANLVEAVINGIKTLKIEVPNDRKLPDLVISKKSLNNGELTDVTATFNIKVTAEGKTRNITKNGQTVNLNSEIIIDSTELETLGIDGSYTGKLFVEIEETSVSDGAARLPEKITVTLNMKDGRLLDTSTTNEVHTSVVDNKSNIEIKVLNSKEPNSKIISGKVWEELSGSKAHDIEIDGIYNSDSSLTQRKDTLLKDIEVTLYRKNGNGLEFVNVSKGTNPTFTDENGKYTFEIVDENNYEYVVRFTYNGMKYQNTINNQDAINGSKGRELSGSRSNLNSLFNEIGSYPANYKMNYKLFDSSKISTANNLRSAYEAGYNIAYRYDQIDDIYKQVTDKFKETLEKRNRNINVSTIDGLDILLSIYTSVAQENLSDSEICNKLQYIFDSRVNAYAGRYTDSFANGTANEYGKCMTTNVSNVSAYKGAEISKDKAIADNDENININLGLVKRDQTDLVLYKYINSAVVSINGHDVVYNHGDRISGTQYIHENDFNYNTGANSNGLAWYNSKDIEVYLTYKIRVSNATQTKTYLSEVADYYDSRFSFSDKYTTSSGREIQGVRAECNGKAVANVVGSTNSKYGNVSKIGLNGSNGQYKDLYIAFNNPQEVKEGTPVDIYVTIKLGNDKTAKELLNEGLLQGSKTMEVYNYAEINGYRTDSAYLDSNSMPGNYKASTESPKENDAWRAKLSTKPNNDARTMSGNIWNALDENVTTGADLANNDKTLTYKPNNGIEGIIAELVELEKSGNQTVVARTITAEDGSYKFNGFIPGDYVVRFTYGKAHDDNFTAEQNEKINNAALVYNGISYQSTKANPNTDTNKYWYNVDKATRYSDAYDDVKSRLNIETQNNANQEAREYTYKDLIELNSKATDSTVYAYTSTIVLDGEFLMTDAEDGSANKYAIENIDFGLTPRTVYDLNINKRVSNIKLYLQDRTLQLDADIDKDGNITLKNDSTYKNIVNVIGKTNAYLDGLIKAEMDETLFNGATLEITYTIDLSNKGGKEKITYIYDRDGDGAPIAVSYYGEDYHKLTSFESDRDGGRFVYHDGDGSKYTLHEYRRQNTVELISNTYATQIIDYVDPNLNFINMNKAGQQVNADWELANASEFVTSRQNVNKPDLMDRYNTIIKAKDTNKLITGRPSKGETVSTTLTLSKVLSTSSTESNEWEYSNLMEITKIYSTDIGYLRLQGYDITGEEKPETSEFMDISKLNVDGREGNNIYPTLGTAKSETFVIIPPTGLNTVENVLSNTVIVLIAISVLAGGIVLIKKFVIKTKN